MRIAVGADHAGLELKGPIIEFLVTLGHLPIDVGTHSAESVDYPDYSRGVAQKILNKDADLGIMICGSGIGGSIAANKFPGIRAGLCHDMFSAHQGREDDDVNLLCLGARVIGRSLALDIVKTFLGAKFSGQLRHQRRLDKVMEIEKQHMQK
jgi:ribose 5-phosphate isomerase B